MLSSSQPHSEFATLNSAKIKKLSSHLKKTKCTSDKSFRDRRKQEAIELAEIAYDVFKETESKRIMREGQHNA